MDGGGHRSSGGDTCSGGDAVTDAELDRIDALARPCEPGCVAAIVLERETVVALLAEIAALRRALACRECAIDGKVVVDRRVLDCLCGKASLLARIRGEVGS